MVKVMIKGITIQLYEKTETGRDAFNRPVYEEKAVDVDNVLVAQPTDQEVLDTVNLTGRKLAYVLGIPKGDQHEWTDCKVGFFNNTFRVIGAPIMGIEEMVPLSWHKKVRVEAYEPNEVQA
jgi:hypothetical protein